MGKVKKGVECSIHNCTNRAVKSTSSKNIPPNIDLQFKNEGRNVYLCGEHYKAVKKAIKKKIDLERKRWKML